MFLKVTTPPATEPITLAEAKIHLRVDPDITDEDALIADLIVQSREYVEEATNRALITQTLEYTLDDFPLDSQSIWLPKFPVTVVNSIKYLDEDAIEQTLDASLFIVDISSDYDFARIALIDDEVWPTTDDRIATVTIEFVAGQATEATVKRSIIGAMMLIIADSYENRQDSSMVSLTTIPRSADKILRQFRIHSF